MRNPGRWRGGPLALAALVLCGGLATAVPGWAGGTTLTLRWRSGGGQVSGFVVERANSPTGPWQRVGQVALPADRFTDTGLSPGSFYYYRVRAYNEHGESRASDWVQARTATAAARGSIYSGLVLDPNFPRFETTGTISVSVRADGGYSATGGVGGRRVAWRGLFADSGEISVGFARDGAATWDVSLRLDAGHWDVTGMAAKGGNDRAEVFALRRYWSRQQPCPWEGTYRFKLALTSGGVPYHPEGFGFGTLIVRADGQALYSGYLSDGTRLLGRGWVSEGGHLPLYSVLYRRRGACVSWVTFQSDGSVTGMLDWFRPAQNTTQYPEGFRLVADLTGRRVADAVLTTGAVRVVVGGSEWGAERTKDFVILDRGRVTGSDANGRLSANFRTGEFIGTMSSPPGGSPIRYRGFFWPGELAGAGFAVGATRMGFVRIEPRP